jgi:hypothetical protein
MSELLRKAAETMKLLKKKPHLKPVAAGGGELSKAERWRTAQMAQDWLNANADPKYHRRRLPDMEESGQFKLLTRGRRGMERFFSAFSNWRNPGIRQLLKEYKIEGEMKGNAFWKSKRDFIDAVRNSKVEQITPEADAAISYRSRTPDKKSLLGLIKSYRSYPKFRNEGTLNAIYDGYKANAPMDRPIVLDFGKGKRRVFSGNTRMDAAFHSGVNPEVLVVPAQKNFSRHEFAMVKPVKVSKWADPETRKKFAKSLRRKLEKLASGKEEKLAIRSALGARPAKHQITTKSDAALATKLGHPTKPGYIHPQSAPQIVKVNGELSLLAFRGAKKGGTEPELKRILSRPRAGRFTTSPDHPTVAEARQQAGGFKGHVEQPQGAYLSLSTNKNMPKQEGWMGPNEQGESSLGVYATNIKKFLKRLANKEIGIVNSKFPQEHEITQKSGGNLISVRKFKGGTPGYHYPGEQRAFSRFHEFKSYDKTGEEERRDFLKAGIVGTGVAAAGGLAGLGLYKAGVSGAAQKLARLSRAVKKASANKAAGVRQAKVASAQAAAAATKQRDAAQQARKFFIDAEGKFYGKSKAAKVSAKAPARPATEVTTQIPEGVVNTQAAGASAPAPAPAATKTPAKAPAKSTASKKPAQTPTKDPAAEAADVLEQQNKQAQAAAAVVPAAPPTATTTKAPAATKAPAKAPVATKSQTQDPVAPVSKRLRKGVNAAAPAKATKAAPAKTTPAKAAPVAKAAPAEAPHIVYNGQKVFTDPDFIKKWGDKGIDMSIEAQKKEIDARAKGLSRVGPFRYFDQFQADEGGIPLTGRVARDRFVKKIRDEDLDRRDANILRAGGAGALAGLLARGPIGAGKRALIGAGAGGLGVLGIRALTNNDRDIYGERNRGSKRAELLPAVGGLGAAAWLAGKRLKAFAKKIDHRGHGEHGGGLKEFGSMGAGKLYRQKAALLKRGLFIEKRNPVTGALLSTEARPLVSDRGRYAGIYHRLANKGAGSPNLPPWKQDVAVGAKLQSPYDGKMQHALRYDDVMQKHERKMRGFSSRLRGVKEFGSSGLGRLYRKKASLLKKGVFIERRNPDAPVLQPGAIWPGSFIETPSFVARGNVNMKTGQVYTNQMLPSDQQKHAGIYHRIASKEKPRFIDGIEVAENSIPGEFTGKFRQRKIHDDWLYRHEKKMRGFSARLRGVKNFDDYRLYYFKGRNTGIAARSAEEARKKKKRGGDELVAVRTPSDSEKSQMARGVWVRTRRDGKSPGQSRYGKGRGQGPARKSMGARLAQMKFFAEKQDGKKRELNPYVGAALSGGASGAVLGGLSILKRGTGALAALKNAGKLGGVSAGIVGGGALLGSRIVGKPREDESAPFTKRAGIGGAIAGAGVGLAGALALRKTKGGAKVLEKAAKNWRPAMWVRESPLAVAGGVGAVGGALYGGAQGLDEGQQVDSIRNLKKDMKTIASDQGERAWKSAARTSVHGFSRKEFQVSPLPDVEPFEATYGRRSGERSKFVRNAAILGAIGLVGVGGYRFGKAAKAAAGAAKATKSAKAGPRNSQSWKHEAGPDFWEEARRAAYGETGGRSQSGGRSYGSYDSDYAKRSAEAKSNWQREQAKRSSSSSSSSGTRARGRGEDANPYAGTPKADAWEKWRAMDRMSKESQMPGERESAEKMKAIWKKRHNLARKLHGLKLFGRDDQPRYRGSKAWADPIHGWVTGADLVDKDGNPWKPSSPQLVNAMVNRAKRERIKVQRGYGLTKDVSAVMQGKDRERDASGRIKKREWEKSWFKNMVTTGALAAAGLVGAGAWRYGRMNPGTGIGRVVRKTEAGVENLKKKADKGMGDFMRGVDDMTGSRFAGRKLFAAKFRRLREFDAIAAEAGWDARDPRGRSVRVFAPGSRRRERREKAWHEKTENERTLWKAGIAAGVLAGGLGGVGIYRLAKGKPLIPRFGKPAAGVGGDGGIAEGPPEWFTRVRSAFKK